MPRYYRRRYTRTLVKPKKKWASNFKGVNVGDNNTVTNTAVAALLCQNSVQTALPTPVIVKTGNFKAQLDIIGAVQNARTALVITAYILYVPEGVAPTTTGGASFNSWSQIIDNHPEWIISWKMVSSDVIAVQGQDANYDRIQMSSRLKRNLNSGDSIYLVVLSVGQSSGLQVNGKVQFWTCAN